MSRVFVAREVALDRNVVVKVLPSELSAAVSAERLRRRTSSSHRTARGDFTLEFGLPDAPPQGTVLLRVSAAPPPAARPHFVSKGQLP